MERKIIYQVRGDFLRVKDLNQEIWIKISSIDFIQPYQNHMIKALDPNRAEIKINSYVFLAESYETAVKLAELMVSDINRNYSNASILKSPRRSTILRSSTFE